jgi:hypothetical protein
MIFPWETELACLPSWLLEIMNAPGDTRSKAAIPKQLNPLAEIAHEHDKSSTQNGSDTIKNQVVDWNLASNHSIWSEELNEAVKMATSLIRSKCNDLTSCYKGMKMHDGEAILKFKVKGSRECPYGEKHTSNSFSVISNGICMQY